MPLLLCWLLHGCTPSTPSVAPPVEAEAVLPDHLPHHIEQGRYTGPVAPPRPAPWMLTVDPDAGDVVVTDQQVRVFALDGLHPDDWSMAEVVLHATGEVRDLSLQVGRVQAHTALIPDGHRRTHQLRLPHPGDERWESLTLTFQGTGTVDLEALSLLPRGQAYDGTHGRVRTPYGPTASIDALYVRAGGALELTLSVPEAARLDLALGLSEDRDPVRFVAELIGTDGEAHTLLDVPWSDAEAWSTQHLALADWAGQQVTLRLRVDSAVPGAVGLWGAPVLSGGTRLDRPNVIIYAIDGGGADYMSLYGYPRRTTPFLEELAQEGVRFEWAHTTSAWTKSSTASFMTSLHHSVLGGYTTDSDQIPDAVVTMAEHFDHAGYQTALLTTNPFAGTLTGLQQGVHFLRDTQVRGNVASSAALHEQFLQWRDEWPAEPYWVHFQTTDVHEPHAPVPPFAETWINSDRRGEFEGWWDDLRTVRGPWKDTVLGRYLDRLDRLGVSTEQFFTAQRDLYDETMLQNDATLRELVHALKARGEWEHTILIITADHGHPAGSFSRFGRGLLDPQPADWEGALADSYRSRVPLLVIWPEGLTAGRVVEERVSLIDLLPTVLDLAALPPAAVRQGRSWRPLLYDEGTWTHPPLVFDQFQAEPESGLLVGHIEVIDGSWAASLEVVPEPLQASYHSAGESLRTAGGWRAARPHRPETPSLLLYNYDTDPLCTTSVNDAQPEQVAHYTAMLEELWQSHTLLAQRFDDSTDAAMTAEQLEALRLLGYVE